MKRRIVRSASLRLVLEDRRVDEILAKVKELDMVLVEMEGKLGVLEDRVTALAAQLRSAREQPSLPFASTVGERCAICDRTACQGHDRMPGR